MKRRLSSRFPSSFNATAGPIPAMPLNASDMMASASGNLQSMNIAQLPPSKYSAGQPPSGQNFQGPPSQGNASQFSNRPSGKEGPPSGFRDQRNPNVYAPSHGTSADSGSNQKQRYQQQQQQQQHQQQQAYTALPPSGDSDIMSLRNPNFEAKSFIASKLSNATDVEISKFTNKLVHLQEQVAIDRKDMVYGNYKTFLSVGSQISVLSTELQILRKLVNDLHVATTAMKQDAEITITTSNSDNTNGIGMGFSDKSGNSSPANGSTSSLLSPLPSRLLNGGSAKHNNRNSVLVLETMWAQDLSGLLRTVEGAQKYLPPIPGRHVVEESSGWDQLNAATWKPWQPVKVYLLNDYLLIAVKKRSKNGDLLSVNQPTQALVADRCWPLSDIQIKDLSSVEYGAGDASPHGFVVQKDRSIFVYRHNDAKTSSRFFQAYNRLSKDLRKAGNNNGSGAFTQESQQARKRESMYNASGKFDSDKRGHKRSVSMDISERTRVLRDIDTLINGLDVKIAHRNFADAVNIIEHHSKELANVKELSAAAIAAAQAASATSAVGGSISGPSGRSRPSVAGVSSQHQQPQQPSAVLDIKSLRAQILKIKLDQRSKEVSDILLGSVTQDYLGPGELKQHILLLIRLKQTDAVKKAFLSSRRQLILKRIKLVEFKGDIPSYLSQIVTVHFRMIRTTAEIYQACFPSSDSSSGMVEWAKNEVEDYILFFARQLYNIPPDSETYRACIDITKEQATQLKDVGLNLDFLLEYIYGKQDLGVTAP